MALELDGAERRRHYLLGASGRDLWVQQNRTQGAISEPRRSENGMLSVITNATTGRPDRPKQSEANNKMSREKTKYPTCKTHIVKTTRTRYELPIM